MALGYHLKTIFVKHGVKYQKGVKDIIAPNGDTSISKLIEELSHVFVPLTTARHTPELLDDILGKAGSTDTKASI